MGNVTKVIFMDKEKHTKFKGLAKDIIYLLEALILGEDELREGFENGGVICFSKYQIDDIIKSVLSVSGCDITFHSITNLNDILITQFKADGYKLNVVDNGDFMLSKGNSSLFN